MKPKVICHMLSPLDGRLLLDSWAPPDSALRKAVTDEYERLHAEFDADAWLAGTRTMAEISHDAAVSAGTPSSSPPERPWHLGDPAARRFAIAIDRHARLHWEKPVADEGHVVVVLAASVSDAHLAELAGAGISYLVMPDDEIDLAAMLEQLGTRLGIRTLLLEGGATMNGAFLKAGLVDEISLLLCPAIDGTSGASTIFEAGADGLGSALRLALRSTQPVGAGAVHLRYDVVQTAAN